MVMENAIKINFKEDHSLSNSQGCNAELSTVIILLHVRSPELAYTLTSISPLPPSLALGNDHSALCFFLKFGFFRFHLIQYLSFSVWLTSFSITPSRSIYVVKNGRIPFFLKAEIYSCVCITPLSTHPLMDN